MIQGDSTRGGQASDDVELTLRALKKNKIANEVVVADDGAEALDYVFGTGQHAGRDVAQKAGPRAAGPETAEGGRIRGVAAAACGREDEAASRS